jgi:tetratricopeptide (TPR) repeat protein
MDIGRPIRRSELTCLYPAYLHLIRPTADPVTDLSEPLTEAQKPVGSRVAMLQPTPAPADGGASYRPFDYLVALADGQHDRAAQPILDQAWTQMAQLTTPGECFRAAGSAYLRRLVHIARQCLTVVSESGDAEVAPRAALNLGVLLADQGDPQGARAAYQQAIDSGHPEQAPTAASKLGVLLVAQGDPQGARAAYQQAIDSGDPMLRELAEEVLAGLSSPPSPETGI